MNSTTNHSTRLALSDRFSYRCVILWRARIWFTRPRERPVSSARRLGPVPVLQPLTIASSRSMARRCAFSVTILGALAQRERDRIAERTRAGLEAARARGRHPGRPVAITPEQYDTVLMLRNLGKSYRETAAATGLCASTVARIARDETPGHDSYRKRAAAAHSPAVEAGRRRPRASGSRPTVPK